MSGIILQYILERTPTSLNQDLNSDNTIPLTVFPPHANLSIPAFMADNPDYFSTDFLIQVKRAIMINS